MPEINSIQKACSTAISSRLDAEVFKALGDDARLALVVRLATASGPMTVSEASLCCGTHLSGVSRHLAQLKRAGIVSSRKEGREVFYWLNYEHIATQFTGLVAAISACREYCCTQPMEITNEHVID